MKFYILDQLLLHPNRISAILSALLATFFIGLVLLIHQLYHIPIPDLTRDPVAVVNAPVYTGFFSQVGIFFWAAAAAISFFTAIVLHHKSEVSHLKKFFGVSGLLFLVLGLDDIFLFHEVVFPHLGIPELMVLFVYVAFMLVYGIAFFQTMSQTNYALFIATLVLLAFSIIVDFTNPTNSDIYIWEDGSKLAGIICWFFYIFQNAISTIYNQISQQGVKITNTPKKNL
ncbi:hypothetical protein NBT05_08370 [Aquimarina sp. ERC-38]|uniref:hypothetical protein n=1 Tax=Aquimarina sp. ERC-38 TaxID=2949996 RepID=UPI00224783D8|nr:hypothetical protein [Aquimarina sp. ERC-38]UZO82476.1 hypothetical protein NBT05_08370 [Aquimarina sp. ERC-38]